MFIPKQISIGRNLIFVFYCGGGVGGTGVIVCYLVCCVVFL